MFFRKSPSFASGFALLVSLAGPVTVVAQTSQGILAGVVRDQTGAVLPSAQITITNEETQEVRTSVAKSDGAYRLEGVPPGRYTVVVEEPGFDTRKGTGVVVNPSVVTSYDAALTVGKVNDVVEVKAVSNAINLENGQLTGILSTNDIRELPIFSLNPIELATTLPGIQTIVQPSSGAGAQGQVFSANGARPRANNFLLDGQEINDVAIAGQGFQPDIPGAYSSVAVLSNSASAEFGRAGGAVTNVVTVRGTNTFHGSAFERYTGSGLNALTATQRQSKIPGAVQPVKTRYDRHTFGFTGGGPIFRDKLFVFGASQWQRYYGGVLETNRDELPDLAGVAQLKAIQAQTGTVQATQAALFAGYLSNYAYLQNFANTTVTAAAPTKTYNSYSVLSPGCPATGCTITTALFQRPALPQQNTDTQFNVRVDYTPRERDTVSVRYIHDRGFLTPDFGNNSSLPGFDSQQGGFSELAQVAETHVFGPRVLNEFRVSETRLNFLFAFTAATVANPLNSASPTISFAGTTIPNLGPNQNLPQGRGEDLYQLQDTVGLTFGKQAIRVGFDVGRQIEQEFVSQNALGTLAYAASGSYGSSIGEFINNTLGKSGTATKTFGPTRVDPHDWRSGIFIEDDIKLTPELTVNLGARYDYLSDPENAVQYPAINPATALTDPITVRYKVNNDYNNISPRAGFAYNPHGGLFADGKTVFHAGFGIYYDGDFSNIVVNSAQSSPNAVAQLATSTAVDGLGNSNALIGTLTPTLSPTASVLSVTNNLVNPYTYQYNLGFERELPFNLKLTTNYVGSRGVKLFDNRMYNYFTPTNGIAATTRLNAARGPISARGNFATSEYNSLQAELSRSFVRGVTFRLAYTLSKDLDNASEIFATFASPTSYQADLSPSGLRQDWGNSAWDHRNYVVGSYVWAPKGYQVSNQLANGVVGALTRHWTISGVERFQSGPYSTFNINGYDTNGDGTTTNDRPVVSNINAPLNTAAIDASYLGGTQGTYYSLNTYNNPNTTPLKQKVLIDPSTVHFILQRGQSFLSQEVSRNSFLNPGYQQHDVAVEKGIGLSYLHFEQGTLNLRVEANDVGNHNNVAPLNINVASFGASSQLNPVVSRTVSGRSLVLWATLKF